MYEDIVGKFAELAVKTFLERDGYIVMPYGVEYALRSGGNLTHNQYKELRLPDQIRRTPDFLVISPKQQYWRLLEVKYRSHWNEQVRSDLKDALKAQASCWKEVYVLIAVKAPAADGPAPENHIRVANVLIEDGDLVVSVASEASIKRWDDVVWTDFCTITDSFPECCSDKFSHSRFRELAYYVQNFPIQFHDDILMRQVTIDAFEGL
jgi:hypothetical protein